VTLAGPSAVYVDPRSRMVARAYGFGGCDPMWFTHPRIRPVGPQEVDGMVSGRAGADGKLTHREPKPYWQAGWLAQHDRLIGSLATMKRRIPSSSVAICPTLDWHDAALRHHQSRGQPNQGGPGRTIGTSPVGWHRHVAALRPRHRGTSTSRGGQADRTTRVHIGGFSCRIGSSCGSLNGM